MEITHVVAPDAKDPVFHDTPEIPTQGSSREEETKQRDMFAPPQGDLFEVAVLGYELAT